MASFWAGCSPGGRHGQSSVGLAECLAEVSCLREGVKKLAASVVWSNGALHLSSNVVMDLPAEVDSSGVHVTGKECGKPCRQAGAQVRMTRQHSSSRSSKQCPLGDLIWTTRRTMRRLIVTMVMATKMRHQMQGESAALTPTQGTHSPRGTRNGLELPMEREYPPDGKHSGMVSSLVSRWENEARSQSSGQGAERSSSATVVGSQLSRSQEDWASNTEAANTSVSTSVSVSNDGKRKAFPNSRRRRAARKAKSELQDGYSSLAIALKQLADRVDPNSAQARKVHSMAKLAAGRLST